MHIFVPLKLIYYRWWWEFANRKFLGHIKISLRVWDGFKLFFHTLLIADAEGRAGGELCFLLLRAEEKSLEEDGEVVGMLSMLNNAYGLE